MLTGVTHNNRMLASTVPRPSDTMHPHRYTEARILGYRLDRIEHARDQTLRYEVCSREDGSLIAQFGNRSEAEKFIVLRELRTVAMRPRHPAY